MPETVHGSAVAIDDRAVLIIGPSGSGKSALAVELIALGATLVSDDHVILTETEGGPPRASAPDALRGRIEARGVGLLQTPSACGVPVVLAVDIGRPEAARLPQPHTITLLGHPLPLLWARDAPNLASAITLILKGGLEAHD